MTVRRRKYGTGHAYYADDVKLPGVTTIISKTMPKPALIDWAARKGADELIDYWDELVALRPSQRHSRIRTAHTRDRDAAGRRGTEIHRLAGALSEGESVTPPEELAGHVDAYRDFLDTMGPVPLLGGTELVIANRTHSYCGTVDLVADLPSTVIGYEYIAPARWLLELKSTRSGIYPESALQSSAYFNGEVFVAPDDPETERPMKWLGIERCGVVWIRSDSWEFRPVDTGPATWDYFLHLRWLFDQADMLSAWIGDLIAPGPALEPA